MNSTAQTETHGINLRPHRFIKRFDFRDNEWARKPLSFVKEDVYASRFDSSETGHVDCPLVQSVQQTVLPDPASA